MKICIISDTHFGARNGSEQFKKYFQTFFRDVFFPYLDQQGISQIIHLGDLVDRRKYIDFVTLDFLTKEFIKPIIRRNIKFDCLVGNHDVPFKNTNEINAAEQVLYWIKNANIRIISEPTEADYDGLKVLLLPWINHSNMNESLGLIHKTKARFAMGHLELTGVEQYKGSVSHEGLSPSLFNKFDLVMSGHFHHRSLTGNIQYVGSPYEIIWSDYITDEDPKGFHIFDTETGKLELIRNPHKIFNIIKNIDDIENAKDSFVRIANTQLEYVVQDLVKTNHKVHVLPSLNEETINFEGEDTISMIESATNENVKLFSYLKSIYYKSLELQTE